VAHGCLLYILENTYRDLFFPNPELVMEKLMQIDTIGNRHIAHGRSKYHVIIMYWYRQLTSSVSAVGNREAGREECKAIIFFEFKKRRVTGNTLVSFRQRNRMPGNSVNIVLPTEYFATGVKLPGRSDVSQELTVHTYDSMHRYSLETINPSICSG